jgi:DNA-binding MarR family transcriptional regulator
MKGKSKELAESLGEFFTTYNNKLLPLFDPEKKKEWKITRSQILVLMTLRRYAPLTATSLGDYLFMTKANFTALLDDLATRLLIQRETDPLGRRKALILLTAEGARLSRRIIAEFEHDVTERFSTLNENEVTALAAHLRGVTEILQRV